ncbi:MAG: hypothetical protein IIC74_10085 [Bacteroidetes bacterium]|nr:hypothetical protein [Bacteroidota bacterium]
MRKIEILTLILLLFNSCQRDDDFIELSTYDDFLFEVTIYFDPDSTYFDYTITFYQTDGYDRLLSYPIGSSGGFINPQETMYRAVKEYKKVGIKIAPDENIIGYRFKIFEIASLFYDDFPIIDIENSIDKEVTIFYDFETKELNIE